MKIELRMAHAKTGGGAARLCNGLGAAIGLCLCAASAGPAWAASTGATTPFFLGALGGLRSLAYDVSADGSVIVGSEVEGAAFAPHGYLWSSATGEVDFGIGSYVRGVSDDGKTAVGGAFFPAFHAFRWTSNGGTEDLGTLGGSISAAMDVSADGSVVVGYSGTGVANATRAFRWVANTTGPGGTMTDLGTLGGDNSYAYGVNADGSVVVGYSQITASNNTHAFRWTLGTGASPDTMDDLGTLGGDNSYANDVSADGTVVVGYSELVSGSGDYHAFRWENNAMADLGALGHQYSTANAVSADGKVVVGSYGDDPDLSGTLGNFVTSARAFRWTSKTGMADLGTLLSQAGVDMTGITLMEALGTSSNGEYIVGYGISTATGTEPQAYIIRYLDETVAGLTTPDAVQTSANQIGAERATVAAQLHAFASQMLGQELSHGGPRWVAVYGSAGSASFGVAAHARNGPFELTVGAGYATEVYGAASMNHVFLTAARASYTHMFNERFGLYGEAGGFWSPSGSYGAYDFSRTYANGAGTATGGASVSGEQAYGYASLGAVFNISAGDQLVSAVELGRQVFTTGDYAETLSSANPFNAVMPAATASLDIVKLRAKWTHEVSDTVSTALWGAWAHGFNARDTATLKVGGVGALSPQMSSTRDWFEYGASLSYAFDERTKGTVFANGIASADVGSRAHFGLNLKVTF